MNNSRALRGFLVLIACSSTEVRSKDGPEIPALESLLFQYEVKAIELEKPMARLDESYRSQLTQLQDQFRAGGNLEGVAAI